MGLGRLQLISVWQSSMSAWSTGILGNLSFVEGAFDGIDISIYETTGLVVIRAGSCRFETIFVSKGVPFFGAEGLPIVSEYFLGVPSKANSYVKQFMTTLAVIENMWKRKGYLEIQ